MSDAGDSELMDDFLGLFVSRSDDDTAKNWVARALLLAFPDPEAECELTHSRKALVPIQSDLRRRSEKAKGTRLRMRGRRDDEPLLALAVSAAETSFVRTHDTAGRKLLFRALVELLAADPRQASSPPVHDVARALRMEIEELEVNPTARGPMPVFDSVWEVLPWFGEQEGRYPDYVRSKWKHFVAPALRRALLSPALPPGSAWEIEGEDDLATEVPAPWEPGVDSSQLPKVGWIFPEPSGAVEAKRSPAVQEEIAQAALSTLTPLAKFSVSSTTVLSDAEMTGEISRLLLKADAARDAKDLVTESKCLLRALVGATGTAPAWIRHLKWEASSASGEVVERSYPGGLTVDGAWLNRPELNPATPRATKSTGVVPIPIPGPLARRLIALHAVDNPGSPVFPALASASIRMSDTEEDSRPTMTALRRTLASRLMRREPWGISFAQFVCGDDLGIDTAPLFYDCIPATQIVAAVAAITFPWFSEKPSSHTSKRPTHTIGSRRVREKRDVAAFCASIRDDFHAQGQDLARRLRQRTRNIVHGLALITGHRPNNWFTRLRIRHFSLVEPVAVLSDKVTGPDWQVRPVALTSRWQEEFRALLAELALAKTAYEGQRLGDAATKALGGTGEIFLDIAGPDEVSPFGLIAYQEGLPESLLQVDNFARQLLNNRLTYLVPEALRVAQMGWHGSREGAWADGSPWSVVSATHVLERALHQVLKEAGWRPLPSSPAVPTAVPSAPIDWVCAEKEHAKQFRDAVRAAKQAMAERHAEIARTLLPRLSKYLTECHANLVLSDEGKLQRASDSQPNEPVCLTPADQDGMLRFLAAGNSRSVEALVGRNLLADLIRDARERKVTIGPIPRRVHWPWPSQPGAFMADSPTALGQARAMDTKIVSEDVPEDVKAAVALLLHGGYADVDSILAAMRPNATLLRLESEPGVLLVEPPSARDDDATTPEGLPAAWTRGCLAFHGLAAHHLRRWHHSKPENIPLEGDLDGRLFALMPQLLSQRVRDANGLGALQEVAAMARACNSLRMDGWARPVGTGRVKLTAVGIARVIAARDGHPLGQRVLGKDVMPFMRSTSGGRRLQSLLDRLFHELVDAVGKVEKDSKCEAKVRKRLIAEIREWMTKVTSPRPEDLVARYVLVLLERGGHQRKNLALSTIQGYAYAVGRPLQQAMPDEPLLAGAEEWEAAYLSAVAEADAEARPARARALARFHWSLSQEFSIPEVSFADIQLLAGASHQLSDAGFLTPAELDATFWALASDVGELEAALAAPGQIHMARATELAAHLTFEAAMRPGESARLQFADVPSIAAHERVLIRKTSIQRLKTVNSRRRAFLQTPALGSAEPLLSSWISGTRARLGNEFARTFPLFHQPVEPFNRIDDATLFSRIGNVVRWATGEADARTYWLRKAAIRQRLEAHLQSSPQSLWSARDLLAEIGHGLLLVTLGSYTHDPVTPFLRWFRQGWINVPADRIAAAAGLSVSRVSRRRGGRGLTQRDRDVQARMAALLRSAPTIDPVGEGTKIDLPFAPFAGIRGRWSLEDMGGILQLIANGVAPESALSAFHWPALFSPPLERALKLLEDDYGISLRGTKEGEGASLVSIAAPRWLTDHGGVADMVHLDSASQVLSEMCDRWLSVAQAAGLMDGVPGEKSRWDEWMTRLSALAAIRWEERPLGRTLLLRTPTGSKAGGISPWPMLRWLMFAAWARRAVLPPRSSTSEHPDARRQS
jgi:hypothetical protein